MKLFIILFTIFFLGCDKPANNRKKSTTTPKTTEEVPSFYCTDANANNNGYVLPCICKPNYNLVDNGKSCEPIPVDPTSLIPHGLTYYSNVLIYYKNQIIANPITPGINNCGGNISCTYSIINNLPNGLNLNSTTGIISGTPLEANYNNFSYVIKAKNNYGETNITLYVKVLDLPPSGLQLSIDNPTYEIGQEIIVNNINYSSGDGSIISMVVSPSLPSGLELFKENNTWMIKGTPLVSSSKNYVITATGPYGLSTSKTFTLKTINKLNIFSYNETNECKYINHEIYCDYIFGKNSIAIIPQVDSIPVTYSIEGSQRLPSGLNFHNGVLSTSSLGALESTSELCNNSYCEYIIKADNELNNLTQKIHIKVQENTQLSNIHFSSQEYIQYSNILIEPQFTDGLPDCYGKNSCFNINKDLPNGLTLNSKNGIVSGAIANVGDYTNFVISANDSKSLIFSNSFDVKLIDAIPIFHYMSDNNIFYQNEHINLKLKNEESLCGNKHINITSFTISPPLPNGLSINPSNLNCNNMLAGTISGQTNVLSSNDYSIKACNDSGCNTIIIKIQINPYIQKMTKGLNHTCLLSSLNVPYCFGDGSQGQLGSSTEDVLISGSNHSIIKKASIPVVPSLDFSHIIDISSASNYNCFLQYQNTIIDIQSGVSNKAGSVICLGEGFNSELLKDNEGNVITNVTSIYSGGNNTCLITQNNIFSTIGDVYCFSNKNNIKKLYNNNESLESSILFESLTLGSHHICGINKKYNYDFSISKELYCWGDDDNSESSITSLINHSLTPMKIEFELEPTVFTTLSSGSNHSCIMIQNNSFCWGLNDNKQILNNSNIAYATPVMNASMPTFAQNNETIFLYDAQQSYTISSIPSNYTCINDIINKTVNCAGNNDLGQTGSTTRPNNENIQSPIEYSY